MSILEVSEIYNLISKGSQDMKSREQTRLLRKAALESVSLDPGFTKVAFDTRRVNQATDFNPRRNLQNYHRSTPFISENVAQKIKNFAKLRDTLDDLKMVYGEEHEWQDSNARILLNTLNSGLRTNINDGDFAESQPGVGSFDYLDELLSVRYRLGHDDLTNMDKSELKKVILSKDEELSRKDVKQALGLTKGESMTKNSLTSDSEITKSDVGQYSYATLFNKLFEGKQASTENPDVERSITITFRDRLVDKTG